MRSPSIILSCLTLLFAPTASLGAEDYTVMTPDLMQGWEAVGRVTFARTGARQTCTGTLVRPDKVLTAAHCLSLQFGKGDSAAQNLIFQAGKSGNESIEVGRVAQIAFHPNYEPGEGLSNTIPHDLAILTLARPMEHVSPSSVAFNAGDTDALTFVGHRADGRNPPRLKEGCSQTRSSRRVIEIDCQAISGNSGAGLFVIENETKKLIAVLSAAGDGVSYAVKVDDWVREALDE